MSGRVPLAWRTVTHAPLRTAAVVAGLTAVVLFMYLQLGLRGAAVNTARIMTSLFAFDLLLVSSGFNHANAPDWLSTQRLYQARNDPEVERVTPVLTRINASWRGVGMDSKSLVALVGIEPGDASELMVRGASAGALSSLVEANAVVVDRISRPSLGDLSIGGEPELYDRGLHVTGQFEHGIGFIADGLLLLSEQTFRDLSSYPSDKASFGLIRLTPGADADRVAERLRAALPRDVRVLTADEVDELQIEHWVAQTAAGRIFTAGTLVALIVGLVVLYQVLSTDIAKHIPEYATLKAMGYADARLAAIVVQSSLFYAAMGAVPGFVLSLLVYGGMRSGMFLPVDMTVARAVTVTVMTLLMAAASALVAVRRLRSADPAECF